MGVDAPNPDAESILRDHATQLQDREHRPQSDPGRIVHVERQPARAARFAEPRTPLAPALLERLGVPALYCHQAEALDLVRAGRSVAVATGTASGKSLVHQVAIAEAAAQPVRPGTALCLFPTKALAQDQLRALLDLDLPGVVAATYDGDTDPVGRAEARRSATVLLTNPEMLHCALLPHHARWMRFFARLRYVVVDEMHVFRGVFGSHVAHLLRRLRRIAAHYGAAPTFICSSATIGRPEALAAALTGLEVVPITDDGSPRPPRTVVVWNPPSLDADSGVRASSHGETAGLLAALVRAEVRAIGFCPSRRTTELVAERVRRQLPGVGPRIAAYRGGLLTRERLEIEDALVRGELEAVVSTSALEAGVDIDGLDACVLDGFPGTVSSFWQRVGRVGRRGRPSVAVLVCGQDQLDQWIAANPAALFSREPEPAVINAENPSIADPHLRCAAFELPLSHRDHRFWPGLLEEGVCRLVAADELIVRPPDPARVGRRGSPTPPSDSPVAVWNGVGWPVDGVGLRSGSTGQVAIVWSDGTRVGTVDASRAAQVVHPGAVYLHGGQHLRVVDLDLAAGRAVVEPDDGATYTTPITRTDLRILRTDATRTIGPARLGLGAVRVTNRVTGYDRHDALTGDRVDRVGLRLPPSELHTRGVWHVVPDEVLAGLGLVPACWPGVLHAAEHAAIGVLPLFAICDRWDVGGVSTVRHVDTGGPTIVIYDGYPGGAGIAELGFDVAEEHLRRTLEVVSACPCRRGCPSCVQSPKCGNGNDPLDKDGAFLLLGALTGAGAAPRPVRALSRAG